MSGPATPAALYKMISIPEAQGIVLRETHPLPAVTVPLAQAHGYILAADVTAPEPVPPFPASIKDGYAVLAADGPGDYTVAFEALAGTIPDALPCGKVAYIGTGGPVPEGADAVVQIEDTQQLPDAADGSKRVRIVKAASKPGQDIRPVGSDIAAGQRVLPAGTLLGAAEIGLLATVGAAQVQVHKAPHVGVLSTGDEVVDIDVKALGPGQIRDANRAMLLAAAASAGAKTTDLGIARDSVGELEACYERASSGGVDVLISTGGVSMGDKDFVKPLLERRGTVYFGKVCMKPGKPLTFATVNLPGKSDAAGGHASRRMLVFGLPGNPVSSIVTFNLTVLLAIRKMAGWVEPGLRRVHAWTTSDIKMDPERPEYHRATLHWGRREGEEGGSWLAASTGGQISSRLLSMRSANALLEVPKRSGILPAGRLVTALLIDDLAHMPIHDFPSTMETSGN